VKHGTEENGKRGVGRGIRDLKSRAYKEGKDPYRGQEKDRSGRAREVSPIAEKRQ